LRVLSLAHGSNAAVPAAPIILSTNPEPCE